MLRLTPEDVLRDYTAYGLPFARPPRLVRELPGGRTNRSFLIEVYGQRLVLRLNSPIDCALGIDRDREARILRLVAAHGLSAPVVHNDPSAGLLITEFIDGRSPDTADPRLPERLLYLLDEVHALPLDLPRFDYLEHETALWLAAHAGDHSPTRALVEQRPRIRDAIAQLRSETPKGALCHHDPTPENVLDANGRLYLLDWEYGAHGDVWFDLAALETAWRWRIPNRQLPHTSQHLDKALAIHTYICALWEQAALAQMSLAATRLDLVGDQRVTDQRE